MLLNNENYYSKEADREYLSVSQYKNFMGTIGKPACESQAMAMLNGEWKLERQQLFWLALMWIRILREALTCSVHRILPFLQVRGFKGRLQKSEEIINRIERDETFMQFMSGEKQVIMTADMFGAKWKIKMDSYIADKAIVDLKVMRELHKAEYTKDFGYMDFIQYWGYDIQGAVYQEVVYRNTGKRLPFFIAAASKEKETDIELIWIDDEHLHEKLVEVEQNTPKILALKSGAVEPIRCELCDYCKHTKVLKKPIHYSELLGEV